MADDTIGNRISFALLSRGFSLVIAVISTPLIVRILGVESYGVYSYILSIISLTIILGNFGIFNGLRKFIPEEREQYRWQDLVFTFYLMLSVILIFPIGFTTFGLLAYFNPLGIGQLELLFIPAILVGRQIKSLVRGTLLGLHFERYSEMIFIGRKTSFLLVGLTLAYFTEGLSGLLFGHWFSLILAILFGGIVILYETDIRPLYNLRYILSKRRELVSFNIYDTCNKLLFNSLFHIDILLIGTLTTNANTGYYKAALVIAELILLIPNSIQTVLLQSTADMWESNLSGITNLSSKITKFVILLTSIMVIGIVVLADIFVPFYYGDGFERAIMPLFYLLPGVLAFAVARPLYSINISSGQMRLLTFSLLVTSVVNITLNIILIPTFGILGAAIGTSIGYSSMLITQSTVANYYGYNPFKDSGAKKILLVSILSFISLHYIKSVLNNEMVILFAIPVFGLLIHIFFSYLFGIISKKELRELRTNIPI